MSIINLPNLSFQIPNEEWNARVIDKKHLSLAIQGKIGGDCILASYATYFKMRKNGAVRVSGIRKAMNLDNTDYPHYWVENKGLVFDCSNGQQIIVPKKSYYKELDVQVLNVGDSYGSIPSDGIDFIKALKEACLTNTDAVMGLKIESLNKKECGF